MGMDNTFFRIKKDEIKDINDIDGEMHRIVYGENRKYDEYELMYFRKNYELNEVVGEILKTYPIDSYIISEEVLKEIHEKLHEKMCKCNGKMFEETETEMWERLRITKTVEVLEVIMKLFDFENYYLIYEVIN